MRSSLRKTKSPAAGAAELFWTARPGQVNIDFYSPLREPKDIFLHMEALDLVVVGIEVDGSLIHELLGDRFLQTGEQALVLGGLQNPVSVGIPAGWHRRRLPFWPFGSSAGTTDR